MTFFSLYTLSKYDCDNLAAGIGIRQALFCGPVVDAQTLQPESAGHSHGALMAPLEQLVP
jgi:hypothetical protein